GVMPSALLADDRRGRMVLKYYLMCHTCWPRLIGPQEGQRDDESMAEACLSRDPVVGRLRRRSRFRGGTSQTRWRDAVCALRDPGPSLAGSGGGHPGQSHTVLDAVRTARRAGKADAGKPHGKQPRGILVDERGSAILRIHFAQGTEIPQRRPVHRRG